MDVSGGTGSALGTVLGEGLATLQGYESGSEQTPPIQVVLLAGMPAMLVLIAPAVAAAYFGLRARGQARNIGLVPALIGSVVVLGLIALNVLAYLLRR